MDTIDETGNWRKRAACRNHDPEMWFPIGKGPLADYQYDQARQICLSCPVISQCEQWAAAVRPEWGMLAGLTPAERRRRHGPLVTAYYNAAVLAPAGLQ